MPFLFAINCIVASESKGFYVACYCWITCNFFLIILVKYQDWQKVSHDRHSTTLTILKCLININHKTITILLQMLRVGCRSPFMGLPIQFTLQGKVKTDLVGHINTPFNIINK